MPIIMCSLVNGTPFIYVYKSYGNELWIIKFLEAGAVTEYV